ncbi:hypothetical protein CAEBREN_12694 [Caenorhabditis brenneri]|uniref:Uncharacterized protein n=1 Tax=Caenorhabditis brenneri TaxID=135651 RepID=G0MRG9_CAEBE|nr:hypothetical protein CAEBREN_12694 [Caenorhabditis brenneri]
MLSAKDIIKMEKSGEFLNGKPIFTATPTSAAGSPVLAERRSTDEKHKKKVGNRSGSKKRSTSQKKKDQTNMTSQLKGKKEGVFSKKKRDKESSQESPTSLMNNSLATCSIGVPIIQQGKQTRLPEYKYVRKELVVTVRDAVIQTDLF